MAEDNWPPDRTGMNDTNTDELDFVGCHAQDDNDENGIRITPAVSSGHMATPSIRTENDLNFDIGSTYPITVSSESESSTVGFSTTENNISASTGGHDMLVARSPEEQHDYNQQDLDKLKKENTELKQKKMCVICRIKDFEYVIQPCGHLICDVCSERDICICNTHITSKHVCMLSR